MTDSRKLEVAIVAAGIPKGELAKKLGISSMGLYKKINNHSEFKASEICKASEILNLSVEDRDKIFFA